MSTHTVCYIQSLSVKDSQCLLQKVCFCYRHYVTDTMLQTLCYRHYVTDTMCLLQTLWFCHWECVFVTDSMCLSHTVCVYHIKTVSVTASRSKTLFLIVLGPNLNLNMRDFYPDLSVKLEFVLHSASCGREFFGVSIFFVKLKLRLWAPVDCCPITAFIWSMTFVCLPGE